MSEKPETVFIPVFQDTDRVVDVIRTTTGEAVPAVSTDGTAFRLHTAESVRRALDEGTARFGDLPGGRLIADDRLGHFGRHSVNGPQLEGVTFERVSSIEGAGPYLQLSGDARSMGLVRPRWRCDTHGETYVKSENGPCPRHPNATLKPI